MATESQPTQNPQTLFTRLDEYPWDQDEEFQGGLRAILGSVQDPQQVEHLTLRARCYYFARKSGQPVDFDGYKSWVEANRQGNGTVAPAPTSEQPSGTEQPSGGGMGEAPKPASFAEICELIATGKPIPGIKDIPDTILEGQASETTADKRKKPWEKDAGADKPSWMT